MSNSAPTRASLHGTSFDVVVIGGGINGVAIARQLALGGKRTLLLEQHDFASGSTSRSTRMIHGGLRYLEHGEIGLVRESLRERERLLQRSPHLVRPIQFVLALPTGGRHSAMAIRAGLWLYGALGASRSRQSALQHGAEELERLMDSGRQCSLFSYEDAQCEFPERLVAEWAVEAYCAGAVLRNHCSALEIHVDDGKVSGVTFRDEANQSEQRVQCRQVVNASGPWVDRVCSRANLPATKRMIGGVRGSHIVIPAKPNSPKTAFYAEGTDGRPIFVVPWNGQLLVGTTEVVDEEDPAQCQPSQAEIDYLLRSYSALFPARPLFASEVRYAFAGVRPLPYSPGKSVASVTRKHILHDHADDGAQGLISIIGGKLTTAASLARECARKLGVRVSEDELRQVAIAPSNGIESSFRQWSAGIARMASIPYASARAIAEWHGRQALCVARLASSSHELRQPLCQHGHHLVAEAVMAVDREFAVSLADILLRRVPVALGACWEHDCTSLAASRIGRALGWSDDRLQIEIEAFEEERQRFLHPLAKPSLPSEAPSQCVA